MSRRERILDDLKKLYGLPPYDSGGNICRGDGYFARSLEEKYGKPLKELREEVNWAQVVDAWEGHRTLFMGRHG